MNSFVKQTEVNNIISYICRDNEFDSQFFKISKIIENKVKLRVQKKTLTNIVQNYRLFNIDLSWISDKYRELVINHILEDLINDDIIIHYKNESY